MFGWGYFIWSGSISTIWPMFGVANQLLAAVALSVATSAIINAGRVRYVWTTLIPLVFIASMTLYAGWCNIFGNFLPKIKAHETRTLGVINTVLTAIIMGCVIIVLIESARRAYRVLVRGYYARAGKTIHRTDPEFTPPEFGEA